MAKGAGVGKKKPRKRRPSQKWKKYKLEGGKLTKAKNCPRCGPGIFLAISKNRNYCGKCSYTEFNDKK